MNTLFTYKALTPDDFTKVITLGNHVHGEGYLSQSILMQWYVKGIINDINTSFVVYDQEVLVGFRVTFSAGQWDIDQWCSPQHWNAKPAQVCYFKCNTVDEQYRGNGIGGKLLALAIEAAKKQGAVAGVSHLWKESPGNSAVKYFTKCGGTLVASHPDKWNALSKAGYDCTFCGFDCHCEAAEMIIHF